MANGLLTLSELVVDRSSPEPHAVLPPSPYELNLLLEWPQRTRTQWTGIIAASVALHLTVFLMGVKIPSMVGNHEPRFVVVEHRIPLYLPPDVMTQKAANRDKLSKHIDLADLMPSKPSEAKRPAPQPSVKHFEVPKTAPQQVAKATPTILAEAPTVAVNQAPAPLPPGSVAGITAPAPPPPAASPFQNVGTDTPPNQHPTLAPPKQGVQAAVNGSAQQGNGKQLSITDDVPDRLNPGGALGSKNQAGAQHAAIELKSDPQGADFKPYLAQILTIVRANWRRVIPESARMGMLRGRTVVEFVISRDGSIPKLVMADSSGSDPLDRAAVAGLSMSNPLPPLPTDFKGAQVRLAFSFAYNMPAE